MKSRLKNFLFNHIKTIKKPGNHPAFLLSFRLLSISWILIALFYLSAQVNNLFQRMFAGNFFSLSKESQINFGAPTI